MKTNIVLDAGTTAFMTTITDRLNRQARACRWLGLSLVLFGVANAILLKRVEKLEAKIEEFEDVPTFEVP